MIGAANAWGGALSNIGGQFAAASIICSSSCRGNSRIRVMTTSGEDKMGAFSNLMQLG